MAMGPGTLSCGVTFPQGLKHLVPGDPAHVVHFFSSMVMASLQGFAMAANHER